MKMKNFGLGWGFGGFSGELFYCFDYVFDDFFGVVEYYYGFV